MKRWVQVDRRWLVHVPSRDIARRMAVMDPVTREVDHVDRSEVRHWGCAVRLQRGVKTRPPMALTYARSKRVTVLEDWYPTTKCQVSVSIMAWANGLWRVCVWGGDDYGLQIDTADERRAWRLYHRIHPFVTKRKLRRWGMVEA